MRSFECSPHPPGTATAWSTMKGPTIHQFRVELVLASWKEEVTVEGPGMRAHAQLRPTFAASTNPANVQRAHTAIWPALPRALIVRSRILLIETEACLSCSCPPPPKGKLAADRYGKPSNRPWYSPDLSPLRLICSLD